MDRTFLKNMTDKAKAKVEATAKRFTSTTELKKTLDPDISASKEDIEAKKNNVDYNTGYSPENEDEDKTNALVSFPVLDDENGTVETQGFVCPTCMTTFQSSEYLERHFEGVHGNVCPVCMVGLNSPEKLQEHYEAEHGNVKTTLKESQFRKLLGQLTKRETTNSRTSTNSIDKPGNTQDDVELEGNFCPLCMIQFDVPEDLCEHYETVHGSERETLREKILTSQFVKTIKMMKLKEIMTSVVSTENIESNQTNEDESFLFKNQIAALEESKALLVSEVVMLRKQVGLKENIVSNEDILEMKVDDLKLTASDDSEFVSLCINKLAILDDKMVEHKNAKSILEEKLKEIGHQQKALEAKYEDSLLEKKDLVKSYDTLLKFKDKQLADMRGKLKENDDVKASSLDMEKGNSTKDDDKEIEHQIHPDIHEECYEKDKQIENVIDDEVLNERPDTISEKP